MTLTQLQAGPFQALFDSATAFLRYVRIGQHEAVRAIYPAVRDQDWNTVPYELYDLRCDQAADSFTVSFAARSQRADIPFDWHGTITGSTDGRIAYRFRGQARAPFLRNRIGLCVLHPIEPCAGQSCTVAHVDGSVSQGIFPATVAPDQPFLNVRSMQHRLGPGLDVRVTFSGETFETEDQRNWSDGSYKTYGTPLELPFPVEVPAGTEIEQTVLIEVVGSPAPAHAGSAAREQVPRITVNWDGRQPRPNLGLQLGPTTGHRSPEVIQSLSHLRPDHLRVDLTFAGQPWEAQWHDAIQLAQQIGCQLEVALHVDQTTIANLQPVLSQLVRSPATIARWLVYDRASEATPEWLSTWATRNLVPIAPSIPVVVGTNAFFAELNRHWPHPIAGHPVCFTINPQVHGSDKLTIIETLESHRWLVDTVSHRLNTTSVISPITLKPRFNPNATSGTADAEAARQESIDDRQSTGFVAAWTAAVLAGLMSDPQVTSLTLYEIAGPLGIMADDGQLWPVAEVLAALLGSAEVAPSTTTHPLEISAAGLVSSDGTRRVLMANLTLDDQTVAVTDASGEIRHAKVAAESISMISEGMA
ncbi:MAG: hypothetical protein U0795_17250 [Pirellulales bacterium]